MPRIKLVRDDVRDPWWTVEITGDVDTTIAAAVREAHPCDDNTCDVAYALENGYPLAAAWLLFSGTEAPSLSASIDALVFNGHTVDLQAAFDEWCASDASGDYVKCPSCEAHVYGLKPGDETFCSSCTKPVERVDGCECYSTVDECGKQLAPDVATCGGCGRSWCARCTPTHGPRCPFEYDHEDED